MRHYLHIAALPLLLTPLIAACSQSQVASPPKPAAAMNDGQPPVEAKPTFAAPAAAPGVKVADASPANAGMPGADRDAKGCIGSAGYAWSHLNEQCIRIFEAGIRLEPRHKSLDKTQAAFAVFLPGDESRVELFLPSRAPFILTRDGDKQAWRDGAYVLSRIKRTYALSEITGAKLYEGTAK